MVVSNPAVLNTVLELNGGQKIFPLVNSTIFQWNDALKEQYLEKCSASQDLAPAKKHEIMTKLRDVSLAGDVTRIVDKMLIGEDTAAINRNNVMIWDSFQLVLSGNPFNCLFDDTTV